MKKNISRIFFIVLSCLATGAIVYLKISSLRAWQYSSDLFSYDQFLNELILDGYPVDFTFGNLLGDHAYFFLFLLIPFKALMGTSHIYFLLLLNPLLFLGSSLLLYSLLTKITSKWNALIGGLAYLIGFGIFYQGLLEGIYGFHPDIGAGFLLIGATCCFLFPKYGSQATRFWNSAGILLSIFFILIKEETALIGLVYFLILFILTHEKKHLVLSGFSVITTILGFSIISRFRTPYNRTNSTLFEIFFNRFQEDGLIFLFNSYRGAQSWVFIYWGIVFSTIVFFHIILIKRKGLPPALIALFYAGLLKLALSLLLFDFDLSTWHNLPGLAMISIVFVLILSIESKQNKNNLSWTLVGVLISSLFLFLVFDARFAFQRYQDNKNRQEFIQKYKPQLNKLSKEIPKIRIVSVPMFAPIEFIDHRFSFYPAGVFTRPRGIADYVIFPRNISHIYTGNFENIYPINSLDGQFIQIDKTKNFQLYKRISLTPSDKLARQKFLADAKLTELIPLP